MSAYELLTSDEPLEVIEQQMLFYLERSMAESYAEPVPINNQLTVPEDHNMLQIVADEVRLVRDQGTSGHYNEVIDAGEVIALSIPLKNISDKPFRSTSGFLQSKDELVRIDVSEVVYTEKDVVSGETITFGPGRTVVPSSVYNFTVSPKCPDGHQIGFELLVWDSDNGKFTIPFAITVYNVGPLDFGRSRVDDDVPGPSNGNGNRTMEPNETVELVLALQNKGEVEVNNIEATLFSPAECIRFQPGGDVLRYKLVLPKAERPISSSFVFHVNGDEDTTPATAILRLYARGKARDFDYSWLQVRVEPIGVTAPYWDQIIQSAQSATRAQSIDAVEKALRNLRLPRLQYRVQSDTTARRLLSQLLDLQEAIAQVDTLAERLRAIDRQLQVPKGNVVDTDYRQQLHSRKGRFTGQLSDRYQVRVFFVLADGTEVEGKLKYDFIEAVKSKKYDAPWYKQTLQEVIDSNWKDTQEQIQKLNAVFPRERAAFMPLAVEGLAILDKMRRSPSGGVREQDKDLERALLSKIEKYVSFCPQEDRNKLRLR